MNYPIDSYAGVVQYPRMDTTTTTDERCTYCHTSLDQRITVEVADGTVCSDCADEFAAGLPDWDDLLDDANDYAAQEA